MANRYWVGGTGNWDGSDTSHWSSSTGGASGASAPTLSDDVFFDANSFSATGQTVSITDAVFNNTRCKKMDWSAATNNPSLVNGTSGSIGTAGNIILNPNMTFSFSHTLVMKNTTGNITIDFAGLTIPAGLQFNLTDGNSVDLLNNIICTAAVSVNTDTAQTGNAAVFNTNGWDITCSDFSLTGATSGPTYNFSTSTITAGTSFITTFGGIINGDNCSVILNFSDPSNNNLWLIHTGSGKFGSIEITSGTRVTILSNNSLKVADLFKVSVAPIRLTFYATPNPYNNFIVGTFDVNGSVGNLITIDSFTPGFQGSITADIVSVSYINVSYNHALGAAIPFYDFPGGINSGHNTNWLFPSASPSVSPSASVSPSPPLDAFLQTIHLVGSDIAGDVQQLNVGKSDDEDSTAIPIYYELETQELELGNRALLKAITDKLGVISQHAEDSKIEIIPDNLDAIPVNIDLGSRVSTVTLPQLKGHYITLRWSGNSTTKSPILEGFYLNKIKDDGYG